MNPLVDTEWLAAHLEAVCPIDASWYLPSSGRRPREEFHSAHIDGAVFFDIDDVSAADTDLPHMLPSPEVFARALSRLGVGSEDHVVVYDGQGIFSSPRLWWTFRVMGHERVSVLDGGLPAWIKAGHPVVSGASVARRAADFVPRFRADLVRSIAEVRTGLGQAPVVDARGRGRFEGTAPEPRPNVRGGHMPGACNLPYSEVITGEGCLVPPQQIRAAVEALGLDLTGPVTTTCGSGITAAVLALAFAVIGVDDVAVYDGSWAEWGGRSETSVVTGP